MLRLAHEWREIVRVPKIRLLSGERIRDFVLSRKQEGIYLAACPQPLHDIAVLMLETGLRIGEALNLEWSDVILEPIQGSRFGFLRVREGKSKNARRVVPLTDRASKVLTGRFDSQISSFVFANREGKAICLHLDQSPAPRCSRSKGQGQTLSDLSRRFCPALASPYNAY
jgi:integrase